MKELGLRSIVVKKFNHSGNSTVDNTKEYPNLLEQNFFAEKPSTKWVGDITYIPTRKGTLYLAVFLDIYSRKVVGWSMNKKMKDTLVQDAFIQAYGKEHPDAGLIVHTDQGSQFTSGNFRSLLAKYHAIQSNRVCEKISVNTFYDN